MSVITKNILTGLIAILPITLTIYLLYWLALSSEALLGGVLQRLLPAEHYHPGLGVAVGVVILFFVGMLMHSFVVQRVFVRAERLFLRLPLVRLIYPAIRDFIEYFSPMKKKEFEQVVSIELGDTGMRAIGLVTLADNKRMPKGFDDEDSVLVYLPMSYMIGGYTILVPRSALTPLDMSMDEAMRFILTAGVSGTIPTAVRSNIKAPTRPPAP
jgi:uncharacterized membrane protein